MIQSRARGQFRGQSKYRGKRENVSCITSVKWPLDPTRPSTPLVNGNRVHTDGWSYVCVCVCACVWNGLGMGIGFHGRFHLST